MFKNIFLTSVTFHFQQFLCTHARTHTRTKCELFWSSVT